jgi:hypothetical protein
MADETAKYTHDDTFRGRLLGVCLANHGKNKEPKEQVLWSCQCIFQLDVSNVDTLQDVTVAEIASASTAAPETSTVHTPCPSAEPAEDLKVCNHCYTLLNCYLFSGISLTVYKYTDERSFILHGHEKRKRGKGKKTVASENEAAHKAIEQMEAHQQEPTMSAPVSDEQDTPKQAWMVTIMDTDAVQRDMEIPGFLNRLLYPLMTDVYQVCCMLGISALLYILK